MGLSPQRNQRVVACCPLLSVAQLLTKSSNTGADVAEATVQDWLEGKLGKALLRKFDDHAEANRDLAVSTLTGLLEVRDSEGVAVQASLPLTAAQASGDTQIFYYIRR
eukprot:366029-Chlamydomonas_euryale.AAC.14